MNSYCEKRHCTPFDFTAYLTDPDPKPTDMARAIDAAARWTTCACGNLCARIPRRTSEAATTMGLEGAPEDDRLRFLGTMFYDAIKNANRARALELLQAVEVRAGEILATL